MDKIPIHLQGAGSYEYACNKVGCFHCEYMNRNTGLDQQVYLSRTYSFGVIPIKDNRKKSA